MKTIYKLLTIILLCNFYTPLQAQSNENESLGGMDAFARNMFETETNENLKEIARLDKLFNSDFRMLMVTFNKDFSKEITDKATFLIEIKESSSNSIMIADFDHDNFAQEMLLIDSKSTLDFNFITYYNDVGNSVSRDINIDAPLSIPQDGSVQLQYRDKDGFWYVPSGETDSNGKPAYRKFHEPTLSLFALTTLTQTSKELMKNDIALELIGMSQIISPEWLYMQMFGEEGSEVPISFYAAGEEANEEFYNKYKKALDDYIDGKYNKIKGLNIFINWAFLYSPDLLIKHYGTNKIDIIENFEGSPGHTKINITKGDDKGKYMVFDEFNRLTIMSTGEEGVVLYTYDDWDFTVNLPEATLFEHELLKGGLRGFSFGFLTGQE